MTVVPTLDDLAGEQFVSLTTFRRSGTPVPTTVWLARDGDALVVTTPANTGKVKRLRHDPRVELLPCSRLGRVRPGIRTVTGTAEVLSPAPSHLAALRDKYGLQYRILNAVERLTGGRRERVILRITLATS